MSAAAELLEWVAPARDLPDAEVRVLLWLRQALYRAQGFPESYQIERGADGRQLSKAAQVRMCGNSVCPPVAAAIVRANFVEQVAMRQAA